MKRSDYTDYDQLPLFLNAEMTAKLLGISLSSAYELRKGVSLSRWPPRSAAETTGMIQPPASLHAGISPSLWWR